MTWNVFRHIGSLALRVLDWYRSREYNLNAPDWRLVKTHLGMHYAHRFGYYGSLSGGEFQYASFTAIVFIDVNDGGYVAQVLEASTPEALAYLRSLDGAKLFRLVSPALDDDRPYEEFDTEFIAHKTIWLKRWKE